MIEVDELSFVVIVVTATAAAVTTMVLPRRIAPPVVVIELMLGIAVGPHVLDLAQPDDFIDFFSNLGLGMLFFFAGYEIDFGRIRGRPLQLAALGWAISIALAYAIGGVLAAVGVAISFLFTGSALATTAIGTLIPILRDAGELKTRFGSYLLAAGAAGEFAPVLLITLVLSASQPIHEAVILLGFVVVAVLLALISVRAMGRGWELAQRHLETSGQVPVRVTVLLVIGLAGLASELGLDILLGGFVAGLITRIALQGREVEVLESKLTALGFGFLIPFFFVTSGMDVDLGALAESAGTLLKLPLFLGLFLVVRGLPALTLYRDVLSPRDRGALAFFSATELPLVVAITTIAVEGDHMRDSTAAALVGAAILSTLVYPFVALALRRGRAEPEPAPAPA